MARKFRLGSRREVNEKFAEMERLFAEISKDNNSPARPSMATDAVDRRQEVEKPVAVICGGK